MDFDSPAAAQKAVAALKTTGVQAQMAKVRIHYSLIPISHPFQSPTNTVSPPSGWSRNLNLIFVVLDSSVPANRDSEIPELTHEGSMCEFRHFTQFSIRFPETPVPIFRSKCDTFAPGCCSTQVSICMSEWHLIKVCSSNKKRYINTDRLCIFLDTLQ